MKRYHNDAVEHLDRALELDPSFAMARLYRDWMSADLTGEEKRANLMALDLTDLSDREVVLISAWRAYLEGEPQRARTLYDDYLAVHPDDPHVRFFVCEHDWNGLDWKAAERCYEDLIARHPNWIDAQNRLGYLALAEGRFQVAEDRFEAYRFVAPDQANPYDSLAELAMVRGQLDRADELLARSLRLKPNFCDSLNRLIHLRTYQRRQDEAREAMRRMAAAEGCTDAYNAARCVSEVRLHYAVGDWQGTWEAGEACPEERIWNATIHRAALLTGRMEEAAAIEQAVRDGLEEGVAISPTMRQSVKALLLSFDGSRLLAAGRAAEAAQRFADADDLNRYWGWGQAWTFKHYNQVDRIVALEYAGASEAAAAATATLAEVNPIVRDFYLPGARALAELALTNLGDD
jgi:Tfp pilus assembly protein PilF